MGIPDDQSYAILLLLLNLSDSEQYFPFHIPRKFRTAEQCIGRRTSGLYIRHLELWDQPQKKNIDRPQKKKLKKKKKKVSMSDDKDHEMESDHKDPSLLEWEREFDRSDSEISEQEEWEEHDDGGGPPRDDEAMADADVNKTTKNVGTRLYL